MVERLTATTESWRPQRRASVFDPQLRRTALLACGGIAVVALGIAGYVALPHRTAGIPVIEADSRPLRVKPDNPGGLQIAGADELAGAGTGQADVMAPAPEVPQPQALRAQIQAARQAAAPPPPPVAPAIVAPAPPMAQPAALPVPLPAPNPSVSAAPVQRAVVPPTVSRSATAHFPAALTPPSSGGTEVQLAAMDSSQAAMSEWSRLSKRLPELMAPHHPSVVEAQRDGKTFYRLRTGGFADVAQATAFCTQVKSKGGGCAIAGF